MLACNGMCRGEMESNSAEVCERYVRVVGVKRVLAGSGSSSVGARLRGVKKVLTRSGMHVGGLKDSCVGVCGVDVRLREGD